MNLYQEKEKEESELNLFLIQNTLTDTLIHDFTMDCSIFHQINITQKVEKYTWAREVNNVLEIGIENTTYHDDEKCGDDGE